VPLAARRAAPAVGAAASAAITSSAWTPLSRVQATRGVLSEQVGAGDAEHAEAEPEQHDEADDPGQAADQQQHGHPGDLRGEHRGGGNGRRQAPRQDRQDGPPADLDESQRARHPGW
jgi:hypothetical protein